MYKQTSFLVKFIEIHAKTNITQETNYYKTIGMRNKKW